MNDLISRQAAIDVAMQYCPDDDGSCSKAGVDIREMLDELESLPSAQPEADRIYSIMKDYYFEHKDEHDQSWQGGFAECMNLIPNVWERREER